MLWRTHFLAGAVAGLLATGNADIKTAAISTSVAGISALLPDLDDPRSKLGRLVVPASWTVKKLVGHRGPLHSLVGAGIAFVLASMFLKTNSHLIPVIVAGYLSHLVMDSLNPQGVPWLWPWGKHFSIPLIPTGSIMEKLLVFPVVVILFCWQAWPVVYNHFVVF